ncbi:MAG TPA: Uma2 family endonuclease [Anaerolineae bacterium]
MAVQVQLMTAEELERMPHGDKRVELVKGERVEMPPAGSEHGEIAGNVFAALHAFVRQHHLGKTYAAETGFILSRNPDTVRAPDAAFVSTERAALQTRKEGFFEGAPDLAVEVVSPTDMDEDVEEKVLDYLRAGTRLVWVARPRTKTISAYRSLTNIRVLTLQDTLDGGDILPGFAVPVKEIFEG